MGLHSLILSLRGRSDRLRTGTQSSIMIKVAEPAHTALGSISLTLVLNLYDVVMSLILSRHLHSCLQTINI